MLWAGESTCSVFVVFPESKLVWLAPAFVSSTGPIVGASLRRTHFNDYASVNRNGTLPLLSNVRFAECLFTRDQLIADGFSTAFSCLFLVTMVGVEELASCPARLQRSSYVG
jgi:hypothetical protein